MGDKQQRVELRVDAYTRVCLTVIAALMTVLIVGLWAEGPGPVGEAGAATGIPDSGQQRATMIKAIEANTAKLDRLINLFETGKAKVQVAQDGLKAGKSGGG